uniref:short transient receptor potential channel 4-like n=1 Tax=Ciona intestinalis TaxID=7719 RepID=UPI000EF4BFA7|nr:short transient receptor potential channel 4-like [Ciona intestinalis]|eukprot:XP_026689852.1 short transient receptor potential channel 4-like [Ciona intestinalis]
MKFPDCGLQKNCVDQNDFSALRVAIEKNSVAMCRVLLKEKVDVGDCLFHAIQKNQTDIVEVILKYDPSTQTRIRQNSCFQPGLTPVSMAAGQNNYDILNILLEHGHHDLEKETAEDTFEIDSSSWECANIRRLLFKARSSPAYITTMCERNEVDPMNFCMRLVRSIRENAAVEYEYSQFYDNLQSQIEDFLCSLLNQIRSSEELSRLFKYSRIEKQRSAKLGPRRNEVSLDFLEIAAKGNLKKVVTHQNCQLALSHMKVRNTPSLGETNLGHVECLCVLIGLLFPILSLFYIVAPKSKIGRFTTQPIVAFHSNLMSQIAFVALACARTIEVDSDESINYWITIWVFGILVQQIQACINSGIRSHFSDVWSDVDLVGVLLYLLAEAIKDYSLYVDGDMGRYKDTVIGLEALSLNLFLLKCLGMLKSNRWVGPVLASMGRMFGDLLIMFTGVLFWVVLSFSVGFAQLFQQSCKIEASHICDPNKFKTFPESILTLGKVIFQQADAPESIETLPSHTSRVFAWVILYAFNLIVMLILWNMLIAMMTKSYEETSENEELEWKFYRTELWIRFIRREFIRPPPMNLIPHPYLIRKYLRILWRWLLSRQIKEGDRNVAGTIITMEKRRHAARYDAKYIEKLHNMILQRASVQVLCNLIWRYKNRELVGKPGQPTSHARVPDF